MHTGQYTAAELTTLACLAAMAPSRTKCVPRLRKQAESALVAQWRRGEVTLEIVLELQRLAMHGLDTRGNK